MLLKPISVIRKISVGTDFKNSMVYMRGQKIFNDEFEISLIEQDTITGNILIYITNAVKDTLIWKEFTNTTPIGIEYFIEYERNT